MISFKLLLKMNRRIGLVFVCERGLDIQVRLRQDSHIYWHKFVHFSDIESDFKMNNTNIPRVANWVLIIPVYQCTTRYAVLPSLDPTEIGKILEYELPNIAPYSNQPWAWDFSIIGQKEDGSSKTLIVLSPLSVIEGYLKALLSLGIRPQVVTTNAIFHTLLLVDRKVLPGLNPIGCLFLDKDYVSFFIIEKRNVTFVRGVQLKKEYYENTGFIEREILRSLSAVKEHKYVCCPDTFITVNTNNSTIAFAKIADIMQGVSIKEVKPTFLYSGQLSIIDKFSNLNSDHYFSSVHRKAQINLLPKHLKEKYCQSDKRKKIVLHTLKICLILLLAFLSLKADIWRKNRLLGRYEQRLSAISPFAEKLQFLQQQLAIIEGQLHGGISILDVVSELYRVLPEDVTVHYLSIEQENKRIVIRAQAKLLSQAFDCISPLEKSDYFANVKQNYANQRQIQDSVLIDFEIVANLQSTDNTKDTK